MTTSRVLVVGGSGMLGHKLVQVLAAHGGFDVHATVRRPPHEAFRAPTATYHPGISVATGDDSLGTALRRLAPDVVVNAVGAIKQKKDLGAQLDATFYVNGMLPHLLAVLNPNRDARVIHFSTDCVFVGDRGQYTQDMLPDAEDVYGRSKAVGEVAYGRHLTIRTSIIGFELREHLGLLGWLFQQPPGSTLPGYRQAIFSGLPTATLSRTVRDLLTSESPLSGLHHVASQPIGKLDLLTRVSEAFHLGHTFVPSDAVRIDRSLRDGPFREATGTTTPDWTTLIEELRADFESLPYKELYPSVRGR